MVERTCVVCRKTAEKHSLLRFVLAKRTGSKQSSSLSNSATESAEGLSRLVFDGGYNRDGRGAYCHLACINPLVARELQRSLTKQKRGVQKNHSNIEEVLRCGLQTLRSNEMRARLEKLLADDGTLVKSTALQRSGKNSSKGKIRL